MQDEVSDGVNAHFAGLQVCCIPALDFLIDCLVYQAVCRPDWVREHAQVLKRRLPEYSPKFTKAIEHFCFHTVSSCMPRITCHMLG